MSGSPPLSWLRIAWGGVMALVLAFCAAPSEARADCSNHPFRLPAAEPFLVPPAAPAADPGVPAPVPPPKPCSGPECSQGHAIPLLPVPTTSPVSDQWAVIATGLGLAADASCPLPFDGPVHKPSRRVESIFHPPRPV